MLPAGENGGGIFIETENPSVSTATVNLDECRIIGCEADGSGGAIYAKGAKVDMLDCTLTGNKAKDGGAVYAVKSAAKNSVVTISRCTIGGMEEGEANTASGTGPYEGDGGGIYVGLGCELTLANNGEVIGNKAKNGGGISAYGTVEIKGTSKILNNVASESGGGI